MYLSDELCQLSPKQHKAWMNKYIPYKTQHVITYAFPTSELPWMVWTTGGTPAPSTLAIVWILAL